MAGFRDILVAFDGSPQSERAMAVATDLALAANARLTVITSAPRIPSVAYAGAAGYGVAALGRSVEAAAERALARRIQRVPNEICVTKIFTEQPIRGAIMNRIERGDHDLVVVGSRDRGPIRCALFGSVSRYVARHSPIPVLVVHGASQERAEDPVASPSPALSKPTPRAV
jgi:nucleotide-binding universal stress UspA family protein